LVSLKERARRFSVNWRRGSSRMEGPISVVAASRRASLEAADPGPERRRVGAAACSEAAMVVSCAWARARREGTWKGTPWSDISMQSQRVSELRAMEKEESLSPPIRLEPSAEVIGDVFDKGDESVGREESDDNCEGVLEGGDEHEGVSVMRRASSAMARTVFQESWAQ
jgi:hypothetical protein